MYCNEDSKENEHDTVPDSILLRILGNHGSVDMIVVSTKLLYQLL